MMRTWHITVLLDLFGINSPPPILYGEGERAFAHELTRGSCGLKETADIQADVTAHRLRSHMVDKTGGDPGLTMHRASIDSPDASDTDPFHTQRLAISFHPITHTSFIMLIMTC